MHASHVQQLACSPLRERYQEIRGTTLELTKPFSAEDQMLQSMPEASPAKWHLAHTTWFFEAFVLDRAKPDRAPFHHGYAALFNSYYESVGAPFPRHKRGLISRPTVDEVLRYRRAIDEEMI